MKTNLFIKTISAVFVLLLVSIQLMAVPATITGPTTVGAGITVGQVYTTEPGMTNYTWTLSSAGTITLGAGTSSITVTWTNPIGNQTVTVNYTTADAPVTVVVLYYPFLPPINSTTIPQFVDPVPHFAAGLRVNAKAGGNLVIKDVMVQQVALSTGTVCANGTIGDPLTPNAGKGNYAAYAISKDGGLTYGPAMWPAQTIEAQQGNQLVVEYRNELYGVTYANFNILADQTLMMNGFGLNGNPQTDPYTGPIPMSVHLHGGEIPSNSDGGPTAWFTPGYAQQGPGFAFQASSVCTYPNKQEGTTLWYHPHDQGLTRINVYTGLAGYYFLRGTNEDALHLPGWSGDGQVQEVTPAGKTPTFNGATPYLPEVELAIQDRMFNVNGELYWPVTPTNPDVNPFWTPEFFGDVMCVNGKSWPYLSVAPRKYAFRLLDGCNARFLNMWLSSNPALGLMDGPPITVLSTEGGMLETPVTLNPALGQTLFLAPAERPIVIIDFTGYAPGTTFTLMNDAAAPYPTGVPVTPGLTDRIMQFVVNGQMVGADNSVIPANLRPTNPMVKLTNFDGTVNDVPVVKRSLLLNEITGPGGPLRVAINNSHFDAATPVGGPFVSFGGPTETPLEGTTEIWQIVNTTADAHPIHPHLVQFQLVSRQAFDPILYMAGYASAWATHVPLYPNYPTIAAYPGGAGSPFAYNTPNTDGFIGGNPAVSPYVIGPVIPALPEEKGWKDAIKSLPGQIETYMVRLAPTDKPLNAPVSDKVFPFDPSLGPGYVYHCHIIDHEDMDMMRPMMVQPSPARQPSITAQPAPMTVCESSNAVFTVTGASANPLSYQWQSSPDGITWTNLANGASYSNVTTNTLTVAATMALNALQYRCQVSTSYGVLPSTGVPLTVLARPLPAITGPVSVCGSPASTFTTAAGMSAYSWATSAGGTIVSGGTPTSNTASINWTIGGTQTVSVNYTAANGCPALAPAVYTINVLPIVTPTINGPSAVCAGTSLNFYNTQSGKSNYQWVVSPGGVIQSGGCNNNSWVFVKWTTAGARSVSVNYSNAAGCNAANPTVYNVTVNPIPLPTITGPTNVNQGTTATYTTQTGKTNYFWMVQGAGGLVVSGQGTSSATILWFLYGSKKVKVVYSEPGGCVANTPGSLTVTVNKNKSLADGSSGQNGDNNVIMDPVFDIYPVPNDGLFTAAITTNKEESFEIQVYNAIGASVQIIRDVTVNGLKETSLDLTREPEGMYFVAFRNDHHNIIKKVVIHK